MTQMMLFDSPELAGNPTPTTPIVIPTDSATGTPNAAVSRSAASSSQGQPDLGEGVHRMGDLARLVLLRYELMAKRRTEIAARQAASSTRGRRAR